MGPPQQVVECAKYVQTIEGLMICMCTLPKVPLLMRNIYMENKTLIGKIDDVFGTTSAPGFCIKPVEGVKGESFKEGDSVSAIPDYCEKLLDYDLSFNRESYIHFISYIGLH